MNILLLLLLTMAVFLYGTELLDTAKNETTLASEHTFSHSGQTTDNKGRDIDADSSGTSSAMGDRSTSEVDKAPSKGPGLALFEFHGEEPEWSIVNDTVMGGVSRSMVEVDTDKKRLTFSGTVSLDNNGGFASTRSEWSTYDLRMFDGMALRVRGDGNVYRLRIRTAETGPNIAYTALFPTTENEWQEIYIPFASMVPLYRGYVVGDAGPLDRASVRSFGLMVADKQQGPFALEVDWINAVVEKDNEVKLIDYKAGAYEEA